MTDEVGHIDSSPSGGGRGVAALIGAHFVLLIVAGSLVVYRRQGYRIVKRSPTLIDKPLAIDGADYHRSTID